MFRLSIIVTICCISNALAGSYMAPVFNLAPVGNSVSYRAKTSAAKTAAPAPAAAPVVAFVSSSGNSGLPASQVPQMAPVASLSSPFLQNQLYNISN